MDTHKNVLQSDGFIYYFGYGANRSRQCIADITGSDSLDGFGAYITDFVLCYQMLLQIPDPPRTILSKVWGDSFRCYTLRRRKYWVVTGMIWRLTPEQFDKMQQWEFIGSWKELITVHAVANNGEMYTAQTEMVPDSQPVYLAIDGLNYETNLNPKRKSIIRDEFGIQKARKILEKIASVGK